MGKKRKKTKAKKKISDLKRKLEEFEATKEIQAPAKKETLESPLETKEIKSPLEKPEITATPTYSLEYPHLNSDLKKSFIITGASLGIIFILAIISFKFPNLIP